MLENALERGDGGGKKRAGDRTEIAFCLRPLALLKCKEHSIPGPGTIDAGQKIAETSETLVGCLLVAKVQFHRLAQSRRHGAAGESVFKAIEIEPVEQFRVVAVPREALEVPLKGFEVQHFGGCFQITHRGEFSEVLAGVKL